MYNTTTTQNDKPKSDTYSNISFLMFGMSVYFNIGFYTPLACHIVGNDFSPFFVFFIHFSRLIVKIFSLLLNKAVNEHFYIQIFTYTTITASILFTALLPSGTISDYMQLDGSNSLYVKLCNSILIIVNGFSLGLGEIAFLSYAKQFGENCVNFWNIGSGLAGLLASSYVLFLLWLTDLFNIKSKKYIILANTPIYIISIIFYYISLRNKERKKDKIKCKTNIKKVVYIVFGRLYNYSLPLAIGAILYFIGLTGFMPFIKTYIETKGTAIQKENVTQFFTIGFTILRFGASLTKGLPYFAPFYRVHWILSGHIFSLGVLIAVALTNRNEMIIYVSLLGLGMSEGAIEGYVNSAVRNKASEENKRLALGYINISLVFGSSIGCLLGKVIYNSLIKKLY